MVRNSRRFLPLAAANVTRQAEEIGDAALARGISTLIQEVNMYLSAPTDEGADRLAADMTELREASVAYPPPLANALANLLAHAEVLLTRHAPVETLFQEATSNDITDLADRLVGNLEFEIARQRGAAAGYEQGILAVVGVLALFWIVLAVQQRARGGADAAAPEAPDGDSGGRRGLGARNRQNRRAAVRAVTIPEEEFANLSPRAIGREPAAAAPVSPAGLSAETALLYRLGSQRVGDSLAERRQAAHDPAHGSPAPLAREDPRLRWQSSDDMLELTDGIDLDEEIEASLTVTESRTP